MKEKNSGEFSQHVYTPWLSELEWAVFDYVDAWLSFAYPSTSGLISEMSAVDDQARMHIGIFWT